MTQFLHPIQVQSVVTILLLLFASPFANATTEWYADAALTTLIGQGDSITVGGLSSNTSYYVRQVLNGCYSPVDSTTVTVNAQSSAPVIDTISICEGDSLFLVVPVVGNSYAWTGPNGFISSVQNPIITNTTASSQGNYNLLMVDSNGCTALPGVITVLINALPASPSISYNNPLCANDSLVLTTSASCDQYIWSGPTFTAINSTSSTLVVAPTDADYQSGSWTMLCVDTITGCQANSNILNVVIGQAPIAGVLSYDSLICSGDSVVVSTSTVTNAASYVWKNASGLSLGNGQTVSIPNLTVDTALYLFVSNTLGCIYLVDSAFINVNPIPATPEVPSDTALCVGDLLTLSTSTIASSYNWTGPNGFSSSLQNPSTITVGLVDSGIYILSVIDSNGCISADSSLLVLVSSIPGPVFVSNNGPACSGDTITLSASPIAGLTYEWFNATTGSSIGFGQSLDLINISAADTGLYFVQITSNSCTANSSDSTFVSIYNTTAYIAAADSNQTICIDSTNLNASPVSLPAFGTWTNASGALIADAANPNTLVSNLSVGANVFYWTLSTANCPDFDVDSVTIFVNSTTIDTAFAGNDQTICDDSSAFLSANTATSAVGIWLQSSTQVAQGVVIVDPSDPSTTVSGLIAGNIYTFVWQLDNSPCGPISTDTVIVTINAAPTANAAAGIDIDACGIDTVALLAVAAPSGSTGLWSTPSSALILDSSSPNAQVYNITQNPTMFIWTLSSGSCLDYSADTMYVSLNGTVPTANADNFAVTAGITNTIDVLPNDLLTTNWDIFISTATTYGQLVNLNNGQFEVILQPTDTFSQSFIYELCNTDCPNSCDTAIVYLNVSTASCKTPNIFTPNGDGGERLF